MSEKCNNNLYIKPVEICNFIGLKAIEGTCNFNSIFEENFKTQNIDLNSNFRDSSNQFIFKEIKDKRHLCNPIDIKNYYLNCVISTCNILSTFKDGYCITNPEIILPKELKKMDDNTIKIDTISDSDFKYYYNINTAYCEDKWYDWIIIPNYHFGNRTLKDSGTYSKEDVKKCYKPCNYNQLPYITSSGSNVCIPKIIAENGIYSKKLDYSPISLINIIGNNKEYLNLLYKYIFLYNIKKQTKYTYDSYNLLLLFNTVLNNNNNYIINELFEKIKDVLNYIVNDNNVDIPDYTTETRHLTYKNPYFNENDTNLITYIGLENNGIIDNDIILIHTYYISNKYYNDLKDIIEKNGYDEINKKIFEDKLNVKNILDEYDIISYDEYYPNVNIKLINKQVNLHNTLKKQQRLANILYKAINICYNNKTDFSKNILKRTEEAFQRYSSEKTQYSNIITDNKINIPLKDYNNIVNIKNGFEIKFYNDNEKTNIYNNSISYYKLNEPNKDENHFNFLKNTFQNNFLIYTEEPSEIIKGNICKSGQFIKDGNCVDCSMVCNDKSKCKNDLNCFKYCPDKCKEVNTKTINNKCGEKVEEDEKLLEEKKFEEIKTPIEEGTIIPDFNYIFKTGLRIFFILIILYIAYMFYKIFGESIMTLLNIVFYIFENWFYRIFYFNNEIKYNEHYKDIIQNKYNKIIYKTL